MEKNITPIEPDTDFLKKVIAGLTDQLDLLTMVQDVTKNIISGFDFGEIVESFLDTVKEVVNYRSCVLYLSDGEPGAYRVAGSRGTQEAALSTNAPDTAVIRWVLRQGRWAALPPGSEERMESILPLAGIQKNLGFLLIVSDPEDTVFNQANMALLAFIAGQTGIALENQELYAELNRSRAHIENIVECIASGIVTIDAMDRITQINKNATAMLGIKSADIITENYREVFSGNLVAAISGIREKILADGFILETILEHAPFRDFKILLGITASLLHDDKGKIIGTILVFRDMSASREIERLTKLDEPETPSNTHPGAGR